MSLNALKNFILIEKRSVTRLTFFLFLDIAAILFSVSLAFLLRFEWQIPGRHLLNMAGFALLVLAATPPLFYFFKLYSFSWVYVSSKELVSLFKASALSFLFVVVVILLLRDTELFSGFPRSTLLIGYFLIFILTGASRFAKRIYIEAVSGRDTKNKERTLIVGAGDTGEQILRSIMADRRTQYYPVGLVDDNQGKQGVVIHGLKVLGKVADIPDIVRGRSVERMIVALPSAGSSTIREAVERGRESGLRKIKIVPSITEVIDRENLFQAMRDVEVEDLLGRDPVSLDQGQIEGFIKEKTILITGAAGSIGSELSRQVAKFTPVSLLLLDQDETGIFNISGELENMFPRVKIVPLVADIQDEIKINYVFNKFSPQIVFHAAAYKHVPLMEVHPEEAVKNNIFGTEIVAKAALNSRADKFIFISTDKAVKPSSAMGATKRAGEMICQSLSGETKFISVRFGNVLGSRGSVIPIFRGQIRKGGPVEVTHPDMQRYFMTTPEACLLVCQAGAMGQGGEVFVLDMGNPVKILDLAKEMIRLTGYEPDKDIPIVFTGVRPGEKFFEDILTAEEGSVSTQNQKIFEAKLPDVNSKEIERGLEKLKAAAKRDDREEVVKVLKELIPNYSPWEKEQEKN